MKLNYGTIFEGISTREDVREQGEAMIKVADGIAIWTETKAELQEIGRAFTRAAVWAEKEHNLAERRYELEQRRKEKAAESGFKPYMRKKAKPSVSEMKSELARLEALLSKC